MSQRISEVFGSPGLVDRRAPLATSTHGSTLSNSTVSPSAEANSERTLERQKATPIYGFNEKSAGTGARRSSLATGSTMGARKSWARNQVDFKAVNKVALANLPAILERLAPGGEYQRDEYVMLNPHREDRRLGSFKVNVLTGRWADFATTDSGGDVISLVAFLEGLRPIEAARHLARMLEIAGGGHEHA